MRFSIHQSDFLKAIQTVQRAVSNKNTLPVLSGVLIKAEDSRLVLTATDLEIGITTSVKAEVMDAGEIVLPANHLASIIRELPSKIVEAKVNLTTYSAELVCGKSRFTVNGFPAEDFPKLPTVADGTQVTISQKTLKEVFAQVKMATSTDESQPFLNGALLRFEGDTLKMAATNSYRLAYRGEKMTNQLAEHVECIVPNKTLDEMARLLSEGQEDTAKIQVTQNQIVFHLAEVTVTSRLIEGRFPAYNNVIPKKSEVFVKADRKELLAACKRVALIAVSNSNIIKSRFDDGLMVLESINSQIGQAHEELAVEMEGDNLELSFNCAYLMDVLKVVDSDQVELQLSDKLKPFIVKPVADVEYVYVISPIRS